MSYFKAKMREIRFRLGLRRRLGWGAYRFHSLSAKFLKVCEYLAKLRSRAWLSRALSSAVSSVVARRTGCLV